MTPIAAIILSNDTNNDHRIKWKNNRRHQSQTPYPLIPLSTTPLFVLSLIDRLEFSLYPLFLFCLVATLDAHI